MVTSKRVVVLGQGYVGLPVSLRAVEAGYDVVGFDVDAHRVAMINSGRTYIDDVTDADMAAALATGRFRGSSDPTSLVDFDVAVISVPTPLHEGVPDLRYIESATDILGSYVRPGCCVILESTTYPGTTEQIVIPRLERASRLSARRDFTVGYSPERIDPSNATWNFVNTPKLISGLDERSLDAVDEFYSSLVDRTVRLPGLKEAELAKLLENTFRHVNIALVNELAIFANQLGIDIWASIDGASTKPFGYMRFTPGPGVGGHCLPIDPSYLSWQVRRSLGHAFRFVDLANDVNEHMPDHVVKRVTDMLNDAQRSVKGSRILLLGLAYKRNSGDARESPAIAVAERLVQRGANVVAADPLVEQRYVPHGVELVTVDAEQLERADLIVVLTEHDEFDWDLVAKYGAKVFDTRNRLGSGTATVL